MSAENPTLPARWSTLLDGMAARYPVQRRTENWLCLEWPQLGNVAPGETQTVQVAPRQAHGSWRLFLTADVALADGVVEVEALKLAARLLVGSLIIQKGVLAIRCVLTDGEFTPEQLHATVMRLATNSARFSERLMQRKAEAGLKLFDAFVD